MTKKSWLSLLALLVLASIFRLYNLTGRMPFGWDQERDIVAVTDMIRTHRPKLIGPVVRGEGGFLLGSLYYYLLLPAVLVFHGQPISLGITSVFIDLLTLVYFFWLTRHYFSSRLAFISSFIWAVSPFLTSISLTSWNVSLIPLFSLLVFHASFVLLDHQTAGSSKTKALCLLALLTGLAFHIHASLFLLIPALIIFFFRKNLPPHLSWWRFLALAGLPLLPLLVFDLRHQFINFHLFLKFIFSPTLLTASWLVVAKTLFQKYALYFLHIFLPINSFLLAYFSILLSLLYLWFHRRQPIFHLIIFYLSYIFTLLLLYRNPDFPEYYFNLLIPVLVWFWAFLINGFLVNRWSVLVFSAGYFLFILHFVNFNVQPYSLLAKEAAVKRLVQFSPKLDLRFELSPGRDVGFNYLFKIYNLKVDKNSPYKAVFKDNPQPSSVSGAKLVFSDFIYGYHLLGFVVE